ncbi:hypothetical protein [Nitriliruptor alkaliphilus]|uniref:hypothetical protein n=1 Tax=Nitriliruptor alkaliphilus TaxID=427918 RepID=UPI0006978AA5|nr:hypothetical protein [Nitriliruptor alkaliphilus]
MSSETDTGRWWLGSVSWLVAAMATGLVVVGVTAPLVTDARVAIVVLALPLGVGVARGCVGSDLSHADRVQRGLVAAAWTATILVGAIVGWIAAVIAFLWAILGGM